MAKAEAASPSSTARSELSAPRIPPTLLLLMILTQFPAAMTLTVTAPLLGSMAIDLVHPGTSTYLVKLITGIVAPALIIGAPLGGWLADRFDRRPLLVIFGSVFVVSAVMPAFLDSVGSIVMVRFVSGACSGAINTTGLAMVGHYYSRERRPGIIGLLAFLTLTGSIATLPIAGAVAATGWRNAFLIFLSMAPLVLLALLRPLPSPTRAADVASLKPKTAGGLPRIPIALLIIAVANGLALNLAGIFYSFYFIELGVKNVRTISLLLMYQAGIGGTLTLLFGRLSKHLSATSIFIICLASAAIGLGIQGSTGDWRIAAASLTFTGVAMGLFVANTPTATIALLDERHRGVALGIMHALAALAALLGISPPLQMTLGIQGIFLGVAAFCTTVMLALVTRVLPLRAVRPRPSELSA